MNQTPLVPPAGKPPASAGVNAKLGSGSGPRRPWVRPLMRVVQAVLVAAVAYFLVTYLLRSWSSVSSYPWSLRPGWLVVSALAFLAFYMMQAVAWWLLLRGFAVHSPVTEATATWAKSILARYVPGNVFMFVGRAWMSHRQGLPVDRVSAAMVYEQALGLCSALVTVAVLFPFWEYRPGATALSLIAIPVIIALLHPRVFGPLAAWVLRLLRRPPLEMTLGFGSVLALLGYYVVSWLVAGLGAWLLARAVTTLGIGQLPLVVVAYALAYVIGMAAFIFPSGIGVREAVLARSLSRHLPAGVALAWALLLRLWVTAVELVFVGLVVAGERVARRHRANESTGRPASRAAVALHRTPWAAGLRTPSPLVELEPDEHARLFRRNAVFVVTGAVLFAVIFSLLSWLKYRAYMDARFDLGNMVQAVYNTAHGHFLQITSGDMTGRQMSRLGAHVDPILALFALPWLVWPSPTMLLVLQSVIVATGAWPAYRLGTRLTRDPRAGALLAGAFLLYPALGFLVLNEFHPVALATPLLLWAFLYVEEGHWLRAAPFLILAAASKETVPLVIAVMGVYFAVRKRSWRPLILSTLAIAYFAVAVWVIVPHFNGNQSAFIARYGDYGQGAGQVAKAAVMHPGRTLGDLTSSSNLRYWRRLLWPLAFTSLLSPLTLLIAAPELLLNGLSAVSFQRQITFHYTALEIPFLYAAAVLGVMRLWRWLGGGFRRAEKEMPGQRVSRETLALLVLIAALAGNYFMGPLPFALPGAASSGRAYARTLHDTALDEAVKMIPAGATVSATNNVGAQLAARPVSYVFPYYGAAAWVVVDERRPFYFDKENALLYQTAVAKLMLDDRYRSVFSKDGVSVFKRIAP
jgi:uncharacterized membrane protein/uncharacterized membrane protein YbhN (UPF0104 family)